MPLPCTPKTIFLQTPTELLKTYFARRGELLDFPWGRFTLGATDPAFDAWSALPEAQRDPVVAEWRRVAEVGTEEGVRLFAEEALARGIDLAPGLRRLHGPWEQAFWVFLEHREIFDVAVEFDRADRLHARYWHQRANMPKTPPQVSPAVCDALGDSVAAYFREGKGCNDRCQVEWSVRGGRRHYFMAYPRDAAALVKRYDAQENLVECCEKLPFLVVFVLDPQEGVLETHARGDKRLHEHLHRLFTRVILQAELPRESAAATTYQLDLLKRRDFAFPTDPKDGIASVRVRALRVRALGGGLYAVDAEEPHKHKNVHDMLEGSLKGNQLPFANVDVNRATLEVTFKDTRPRVLPIFMTPRSCSLRRAPRHVVARRCLGDWGLACA